MNSFFNYQLPSLICKWIVIEKSCRSHAGSVRRVEFVVAADRDVTSPVIC